ncbi:MAG: efflux RND transporter periplasmic adaptor subunit [Desulfobacterales bacterium]
MQRKNKDQENKIKSHPENSSGKIRLIFKVMLPVVVILIGIAASSYLKSTGPTTQRRPPVNLAPAVQVKPLFPEKHQVMVNAMGTVLPAQSVELKSRVSGEVVETHPEFSEGGLFRAGTKMIQIDPVDYQLALIQKEKALADANYELKLELGRQEVAKKEWQLLDLEKDSTQREIELALRKPHLEKARVAIASAEAELEKARLDLSRTKIVAPFNAMIRNRYVNRGSQVMAQQPLAELVGTDVYWIQATVPIERLSWMQIPQKIGDPGSDARITYSNEYEISGKIVRLLGDLSGEGRMARVLIEVKDPLGLKKQQNEQPPLLIGDFVKVQIEGRLMENVYEIPRTALRDNAFIWIVNKNSTLEIKKIEAAWRGSDVVLADSGINPGELLIITDLPAPVDGMSVQLIPFDDTLEKADQFQQAPEKS